MKKKKNLNSHLLSFKCLIYQRKPGRTAGHDSQENFEYPNGTFSKHWQKTREGYCSVIEANLIIEIEA